jgi:hypothetical protein
MIYIHAINDADFQQEALIQVLPTKQDFLNFLQAHPTKIKIEFKTDPS